MKDEYGCERGELSRRVYHLEKENQRLKDEVFRIEQRCQACCPGLCEGDDTPTRHAVIAQQMEAIEELRRENEKLRELHRCDHNGRKLNEENLRLNDENYKLGVEIYELRAKLENARIALGPK